MAPARALTARGLRQRCRSLRTSLVDYQVATDAEVAAVWPGSDQNPDRGYDGWIECYAQLTALARRQEQRTGDTTALREALATAVQRAAARGAIPVALSTGPQQVYPKSLWALWYLQSLDALVRSTATLAEDLATVSEGVDLRGLPTLTQGLAWRTWAWILTHSEVGLPFADAASIDPPAWTADLLPEDFVALYLAHRTLHLTDSAVMAGAFPAEGRERSRLDLGGFVAGYASEHGLRPGDIIRQWSLPELFAAAVSAAESHRVATANAKSSRER